MSDSLADSHLNRTVHVAGAAAELAADATIRKICGPVEGIRLCAGRCRDPGPNLFCT